MTTFDAMTELTEALDNLVTVAARAARHDLAALRIRIQRTVPAAFSPFARRYFARRYGPDSGAMAFDEWAECGPLLFWRPCQCPACKRERAAHP